MSFKNISVDVQNKKPPKLLRIGGKNQNLKNI